MAGSWRLVERDERLPWAIGTCSAICDGDRDVLGAAAGGCAVGSGAAGIVDVMTSRPVVCGLVGGGRSGAGGTPPKLGRGPGGGSMVPVRRGDGMVVQQEYGQARFGCARRSG